MQQFVSLTENFLSCFLDIMSHIMKLWNYGLQTYPKYDLFREDLSPTPTPPHSLKKKEDKIMYMLVGLVVKIFVFYHKTRFSMDLPLILFVVILYC